MADAPGVVVVWSNGEPRLDVFPVPAGGLEFGGAQLPNDDELALNHVRIDRDRDDLLIIDLGGGTFVRRRRITTLRLPLAELPCFLLCGNTALAVLDDVVTFGRDPRLGGWNAPVIRAIDAAAHAEEHLSLRGPDHVTGVLARRYAEMLGTHVTFRPGGDQHLDHLLSTRGIVRTIILDLSRPLFAHDVSTIERLLETDVRFVVVRSGDHYDQWLPAMLRFPPVRIPELQLHALPSELLRRVEQRVAGGTVHASAVVAMLDHAATANPLQLDQLLRTAIEAWAAGGGDELRDTDLPG